MANRNIRKYIDLIRKVSGKWTNWDPPIRITPGAYGTLDENGEFCLEGSIYDGDFQMYLDDHSIKVTVGGYPPEHGDPEGSYIIASAGVTRRELDAELQANLPTSAASVHGTWTFQRKSSALAILIEPRTIFIPEELLPKLLNVEILRGKYLVTRTLTCPAYLMYMPKTSGVSFSAVFCDTTQEGVNNQIRSAWTQETEGLMRRATHHNGDYVYTPLFTLKKVAKREWFNWRGEGEQPGVEEYTWHDVYPSWKPLDENGEEIED